MIDSPQNDWSPIGGYQNQYSASPGSSLNPAYQNPNSKLHPDTPPISGHSSANSNVADGPAMQRPNGNPSPPNSVTARSSNGTLAMDKERNMNMEAALAEHHRTLTRYLAPNLREIRANVRLNARDKLLRLSGVQFQELSTDVYDELNRREDERRRGGPDQPGNPVPKHLLPRQNFHFKRNQAREKLSTLTLERFQQLATDVYFELERRFPRFARAASRAEERRSPSQNGYRAPSRSGDPHMRSRSRDGFFPDQQQGYGSQGLGLENVPTGDKPLPKSYQSNVMVPNKGTMVEDDSDNEGTRSIPSGRTDSPNGNYRDVITKLESKVDELSVKLQDKDKEINDARSLHENNTSIIEAERTQWNTARNSLDNKLKNSQSELERLRSDHSRLQDNEQMMRNDLERERRNAQDHEETIKVLRSQFEAHQIEAKAKEQKYLSDIELHKAHIATRGSSESDSWKDRCEVLEKDLSEQRKITEEVRQDTTRFLLEMRELSRNEAQAIEKEEQLMEQVVKLESEVKLWKSRYSQAKSGAVGSTSFGGGLSQNSSYFGEQGQIRDIHFTNFQLAVDELIKNLKSGDPTFTSQNIKQVIMAVRAITLDISDSNRPGHLTPERTQLRNKLSMAANNLISSTKTLDTSSSVIETAALHLTNDVNEVVQILKLRSSSVEELDHDHRHITPIETLNTNFLPDSTVSSPQTHTRTRSTSSAGFSNYSRYSSRHSANTSPEQLSADFKSAMATPQTLGMLRENGVEEFKNFLEDSAAEMVRSIQPLVNTIRNGAMNGSDIAIVNQHIRDIDNVVIDITDKCDQTMKDLRNAALEKHVPPVVKILEKSIGDMKTSGAAGYYERVPQVAFRLARVLKELTARVDRIETGQLTAEMNAGDV